MTVGADRSPNSTDPLARWKLIGAIATAGIVLLIPLSLVVDPGPGANAGAEEIGPSFVGRERCAPCHEAATEAWWGSDHDLAMAEATEETVLGDFNDVEVEYHGITSRFFRRDGGFFVHTEGPGGEMGEFEIAYTFGHDPLQQYLVPFPGGRLPVSEPRLGQRPRRVVPPLSRYRDPARRLAPLDPQRAELERDVRRVPLHQSGQGL